MNKVEMPPPHSTTHDRSFTVMSFRSTTTALGRMADAFQGTNLVAMGARASMARASHCRDAPLAAAARIRWA